MAATLTRAFFSSSAKRLLKVVTVDLLVMRLSESVGDVTVDLHVKLLAKAIAVDLSVITVG